MSSVFSKLNQRSLIGRSRRILVTLVDWLNRAEGLPARAEPPKLLVGVYPPPAERPGDGLAPQTTFPLNPAYSPEKAAALLSRFKEWNTAYRFGPLATVASTTMPGQGDERRLSLRFDHIFSRLLGQFGGSLAGLSVLDIGCHDGFFSIQSKLLGAKRVVGIDARLELVEQSRLVCELAGVRGIEFRQMSVLQLSPGNVGVFDVVLCPGVLYHLSKPQNAVDALRAVTGKLCVIDTHIAKGDDLAMRGLIENPEYTFSTVERGGLVWFPTEAALYAMLRHAGFRQISTLPVLRDDMPPDYLGDYEFPRITVMAGP
jgi:2-polyprenyl-3-methyl-5-hydroxy-6-metoxy-1,4-benzoquinol methylase